MGLRGRSAVQQIQADTDLTRKHVRPLPAARTEAAGFPMQHPLLPGTISSHLHFEIMETP